MSVLPLVSKIAWFEPLDEREMVGVRPRTTHVSLTLVPMSQSGSRFDGKGQGAAEPSLALCSSNDLPKPETQ